MNLQKQAQGLIDSLDSKKYVTYEMYCEDRINSGQLPIKKSEWDIIISIVGNRSMQYSDIPKQWLKNVQTALKDEN